MLEIATNDEKNTKEAYSETALMRAKAAAARLLQVLHNLEDVTFDFEPLVKGLDAGWPCQDKVSARKEIKPAPAKSPAKSPTKAQPKSPQKSPQKSPSKSAASAGGQGSAQVPVGLFRIESDKTPSMDAIAAAMKGSGSGASNDPNSSTIMTEIDPSELVRAPPAARVRTAYRAPSRRVPDFGRKPVWQNVVLVVWRLRDSGCSLLPTLPRPAQARQHCALLMATYPGCARRARPLPWATCPK